MSDPLFRDADEQERMFAPDQVPETSQRARLEGDLDASAVGAEPPGPAPVANVGTSPSSMAAPPNIGHIDRGGAPGDPQTQADPDPLGADE
ncbi:MAG TPA: hypothetical protein VD886_03875 [Herpetosiphonaceae bacterium]|nr:hypothetical protein [Herpetosiphonaceae bacterium]